MKNTRLFIAVISTTVWEAAIVSVIKWGLSRVGIRIPLWGTVLICLGFAIYSVTFYRIGSRTIRKKSLPGSTTMIGVEGRAASLLDPEGFVRIEGELWEARAETGRIDRGTDIVVVNQSGFKLVVRKK
jgi:membrane-bound serine protease (ClpP class)